MGEYLSKPIVDKTSNNEHFAHLSYGASTMQGWRSSQEDAHNCIPEFDENTALFAVYDGHGGSSVAKYCSTHLPNYISTLESYKSGNIAQALEDGFLGFDGTLTNENVIEILRNLSRDATDMEDDNNSIPDEDELQELRREAEIPTEKLKEYYQYKKSALEDTEENPQSPSSKSKPSVTSEKNSSVKNHEESVDAECKLANGESGDTDAESHVKDRDSKIVKGCDGDEPKSSTCTDKGKKLVKGGKRATDVGEAKPGCSSMDEPGPSQHPEPKRERKLPVVTQVGSDSEDSDMEDETYAGDALDESESDNDDDEDDDDDDDDSSEEDGDEKDGEEEDDSLELAKLQELDQTFNSGCTAVVAILRGCELYVANAGDSRCVVSRKGKAIEMSVDHKPEDELEKKRITNAGGKILAGRINGDLNLSRALGDHRFKQNKELEPKDQMISALPDIRTLTIDPEEDEFLILACDGIWNYMNSQEVVDFVRKRLADDMEEISSICEQLFDHCLAPDTSGDGTGCDNMTAIIVKFHQTLGQHVSAKSTHKSHKVKEHEKPELKEDETECKKAKLDSGSQQTSEADS